MRNDDAVFYIRYKNRQEGGFTEAEFIAMIQKGELLPDHEIQVFGMKSWVALKDSLYAFYLTGSSDDHEK